MQISFVTVITLNSFCLRISCSRRAKNKMLSFTIDAIDVIEQKRLYASCIVMFCWQEPCESSFNPFISQQVGNPAFKDAGVRAKGKKDEKTNKIAQRTSLSIRYGGFYGKLITMVILQLHKSIVFLMLNAFLNEVKVVLAARTAEVILGISFTFSYWSGEKKRSPMGTEWGKYFSHWVSAQTSSWIKGSTSDCESAREYSQTYKYGQVVKYAIVDL